MKAYDIANINDGLRCIIEILQNITDVGHEFVDIGNHTDVVEISAKEFQALGEINDTAKSVLATFRDLDI